MMIESTIDLTTWTSESRWTRMRTSHRLGSSPAEVRAWLTMSGVVLSRYHSRDTGVRAVRSSSAVADGRMLAQLRLTSPVPKRKTTVCESNGYVL